MYKVGNFQFTFLPEGETERAEVFEEEPYMWVSSEEYHPQAFIDAGLTTWFYTAVVCKARALKPTSSFPYVLMVYLTTPGTCIIHTKDYPWDDIELFSEDPQCLFGNLKNMNLSEEDVVKYAKSHNYKDVF